MVSDAIGAARTGIVRCVTGLAVVVIVVVVVVVVLCMFG
jgi:hypothetical protein